MDALVHLYGQAPLWPWIALGALLLAAETATGSGWLLWPAVCAALVGLLHLTPLPMRFPGDLAAFALLTLATTASARRWLGRPAAGPDLNDQAARLVGRAGTAATDFVRGEGRALVGGSEWPAALADGGVLAAGEGLVVVGLDGPRLLVRPL